MKSDAIAFAKQFEILDHIMEQGVIVHELLERRDNMKITHRELCMLAAEWIRHPHFYIPCCPNVAVELKCGNDKEVVDVFAWCYWTSVMIECKVSHSDFMADLKKPTRLQPEQGVGEYRYYCCPDGVIKEKELPTGYGLLYEENDVIRVVKEGTPFPMRNATGEVAILNSIMRREGLYNRIFNYKDK